MEFSLGLGMRADTPGLVCSKYLGVTQLPLTPLLGYPFLQSKQAKRS